MVLETKCLGSVECDENSIIFFAAGIPGFEELKQYVCLEQPEFRPLVYLQSAEDPCLCFLALPVGAIEQSYTLNLNPADAEALGLQGADAVIGDNVVCLAIVSTRPGHDATANLLSPIVINVNGQRGKQVVQHNSQYDWQHPLICTEPVEVACS